MNTLTEKDQFNRHDGSLLMKSNRPDGIVVELPTMDEATRDAIQSVRDWMLKMSRKGVVVDHVSINWKKPIGIFTDQTTYIDRGNLVVRDSMLSYEVTTTFDDETVEWLLNE